MPRHLKSAFSLLFIVVLTAIACMPAAQPTPAAAVATATPKQPQAPAQPVAPTAVPTPTPKATTQPQPTVAKTAIKRGGTYRMQNIGIDNLDVSQTTMGNLQSIAGACYERLVNFRAATLTDGTLVPWLAKSWEVSADGKAWTFHLQQNVHWQNLPPVNGRLFTSKDVGWTVDYVKKKTVFASLWAPVVSYDTPDDYTIVFHTATPVAPFMALVGSGYNKIYPHELVERDGSLKQAMVCTGPFMFEKWAEGSSVSLAKNPNYWRIGEDGKPLPYLDRVVTYTVQDLAARLAALRTGQTDQFYGTMGQADALSMKKTNPDVQVNHNLVSGAHGILMNVSIPPWNDVRMRKALSLSIDREKYIQLLFDGDGVWNSYVPLDGWGWDEQETRKRFQPDLEQAKALLKAAGYTGTPLLYTGFNGGAIMNNSDAGSIIFQMTEPAGFKWSPKWNPDSPTQRRTFDAGTWGAAQWAATFSGQDPDDFLYAFFYSTSPSTTNWTRVKDPALDKLLDAQRTEVDVAKRKQVVLQTVNYLYDQMYFIPVASLAGYSALSGPVRGVPWHKSTMPVDIAIAWLDK